MKEKIEDITERRKAIYESKAIWSHMATTNYCLPPLGSFKEFLGSFKKKRLFFYTKRAFCVMKVILSDAHCVIFTLSIVAMGVLGQVADA